MNRKELQLTKRCLNGDSKAQRTLYETFKVPMFRLCLRYANNRQTAEDMLQDGFIMVFKDLKHYKGSGALGGWIRKVMINVALQHIRKRVKLFAIEELEAANQITSKEETIYEQLGAKELTMLIQQLPDGYRMVFNLYVVEGYAHKEIADLLNISVSTSKSQLFKAKAQLRHLVVSQQLINKQVG